jgi:transposase
MIYVGIDVAKDKHDCHIFDSDGVVLADNFSFKNSKEGFAHLLTLVLDLAKKQNDSLKFGIEHTGHYSSNLIDFLTSHGYEVVRFNPLTVNRLRTSGTLRKTKNDICDARYIASLLIADTTKHVGSPDPSLLSLKSLTRARYRLVKEAQPLKNRFRRLLHLLFPEIQGFFASHYSNTALCLFAALPGAKPVADCDIRKLSSLLMSFSHGRLGRNKAENLKTLAKNSIAFHNHGSALELSLVAERILFFDSQREKLENEIAAIMTALHSPVTSVPGIGVVLGASILAEIGDIHAFSSPAKLLAFAGAEPSTYQSGKFTATRTPMVKRGSRYLRNALYLATSSAFVHNPVIRDYVNKKRTQGKHFYTAMSHGMKKMSRILFAVLSKNVQFSYSLSN